MSVRARFGFSLFANLSKAIITFGTGLLVARGLGPEQYGTMMFLLGTFVATQQFFDVGTSSAFFTFLSQRQRTRRFVGSYFIWLGVQFLIPFLAIGMLFPSAWVDLIWHGVQRDLVVLAFVASFMQSMLWSVIVRMAESQRMTRRVQGLAVFIALTHLLLMMIAWRFDWLEVRAIFLVLIIEWVIAATVIIKSLNFPIESDSSDAPALMVAEFWRYCLPLIPYAWLGFAYEFADRWLMQTYAGSVQQAYYSVAYQFGAVAAIATSSILNIFWKEIAEAHHQNNTERVALVYKKVTRGLFFLSATIAGLLAPWTEEILNISLGAAYTGGAMTLALMFFYPMHQSMGQIGGTLAYATAQIKPYVAIGMVFMATSIVVTYFVLATSEAPLSGLGLGSVGLASKMVVMQVIQVNVLAFYLSSKLGIKFDWLFQPISAILCLGAGFVAYTLSHAIIENGTVIGYMAVSGILYLLIVGLSLYSLPWLVGMTRFELLRLAQGPLIRGK
jgi:O-antigen/teichoic acid export membrane protein